MTKYYTRACNFYYGNAAIQLIKKKQALPLCGNNNTAFDTLEIIRNHPIGDFENVEEEFEYDEDEDE